jgi:acyl transferase domain-containing protein
MAHTRKDVLHCQGKEDFLQSAEYSQPVCTGLQIALINMLASCGVEPKAVVGHSSGEIAAAYAAGAITMKQAIICAYLRGLASNMHPRKGCMAAIGLGREVVAPLLVDGAVIACENSAHSVTISGDTLPVDDTLAAVKSQNPTAFIRRLAVDKAYHSR